MGERDYPVGHPAACDYAGETYIPPRAPHSEDYPPDHPARAGKNIDTLSTCDGVRKQVLKDHALNAKRTKSMQRQAAVEGEATEKENSK